MQAQSPDMSRESPLHEPERIRLRGMIQFFVWFFVGMVVVHGLIFALYKLYLSQAQQTNVPITALDREAMRTIPPHPRLQPSRDYEKLPREDLEQLRARELEEFKRRGWVNEQGQIRIPNDVINQVVQMSQPTTRRTK